MAIGVPLANGAHEGRQIAPGKAEIIGGLRPGPGQEERAVDRERGDQVDRVLEAAAGSGLDEQPRERGVEGQIEQLAAEARERGRALKGPQRGELLARRVEGVGPRRVEHGQRGGVLAPRGGGEHERHQRLSLDLRERTRRQVRRLAPEAIADAWPGAPCAAGALICAVERDGYERQEASPLVVAGLPHEPAVDHDADAWERDRGLGDVGREHDLAPGRGLEGPLLLGHRQPAMELEDLEIVAAGERPGGGPDLGLPRKEHQHVARITAGSVEGAREAPLEAARVGQQGAIGDVACFHGEPPDVGVEVGPVDVGGDAGPVERRAHQDEPGPAPLAQEREQQIELERALVELVEHDGVERARALEPAPAPERDAGGGEEDAGLAAGHPLVADVVPDPRADPAPLELGDAARQAAACDPARLDHECCPRAPPRHLGRLARASRRREHDRPLGEARQQLAPERVDGQLRHAPLASRYLTNDHANQSESPMSATPTPRTTRSSVAALKRPLKRLRMSRSTVNQLTMPAKAPTANGSASPSASGVTRPVEKSVVAAAVQVTMNVGFSAVIVKPSAKLPPRPARRSVASPSFGFRSTNASPTAKITTAPTPRDCGTSAGYLSMSRCSPQYAMYAYALSASAPPRAT
jgi:hypothetical protein